MTHTGIWKYITPQHNNEFILSLELLGETDWPEEKQLACLYSVSNHTERHYNKVRIPKRTGGYRTLYVPDPLLKGIQRQILTSVLETQEISPYATAYQKGSSVRDNAAVHLRQPMVLTLDIADFFPTIHFLMIYRKAFPNVLYPPAVKTLLTSLCCYKDQLPQGAPTSAAISNLVLKEFDTHMGEWCKGQGVSYTRYCDDMTFSGDFNPSAIISKVKNFLKAMGFILHPDKIKVIPQGARQLVTGVVVNEKLQTSQQYRRKLRQEIYYCLQYGPESHLKKREDTAYLPQGKHGVQRYVQSLLGKINHVLHINPDDEYFVLAKQEILALWNNLIKS